jgi:hypothetical protein
MEMTPEEIARRFVSNSEIHGALTKPQLHILEEEVAVAIRAAENDALAQLALRPIETAPKKGAITLYAPNAAGDGHYVVGIWYFEDWAMAEPELGERLRFTPTHWAPLPKQLSS